MIYECRKGDVPSGDVTGVIDTCCDVAIGEFDSGCALYNRVKKKMSSL